MGDIKKTQHFTTQSKYILSGLIEKLPEGIEIVEPFYGEGDLIVDEIKYSSIEKYDIEPKGDDIVEQDTLRNPPSYKGKWVITNPPYLAKNKAKEDKDIFIEKGYDDLYKIALSTMLESEGGILVIPMNFFTDERSHVIRTIFMDRFQILKINFFLEKVFDNTTYNVCSFVFKKKGDDCEIQEIPIKLFPSGVENTISLVRDYGYQLGGEVFSAVKKKKSKFGRLEKGKEMKGFQTNIQVNALDTRTERFHIYLDNRQYYGKSTDRMDATLYSEEQLDEETQLYLVETFNKEVNEFRDKYNNLVFSNYRDGNRKKLGFTFLYKWLTMILEDKNKLV